MWAFFRPLPLFPQQEVQRLLKGGRIHVVVPYPWGDESVSLIMYYLARNGHCKDKYGYPTDAPILFDFVRLRWLKWAKNRGDPLLF